MNNLKLVLNYFHIPKGDLDHLLISAGQRLFSELIAESNVLPALTLYPIIKCSLCKTRLVLFEPMYMQFFSTKNIDGCIMTFERVFCK